MGGRFLLITLGVLSIGLFFAFYQIPSHIVKGFHTNRQYIIRNEINKTDDDYEKEEQVLAKVEYIDFDSWTPNQTAIQECREKLSEYFNPSLDFIVYKNDVDPRKMVFPQHKDLQFSQRFNNTEADQVDLTNMTYAIPHQSTCAVVGNSGILKQSRCGQEIDKMDFVFRVNNPNIADYIEDVGHKTNVTSLNVILQTHMFPFIFTKHDLRHYKEDLRRLYFLNDSIIWYPRNSGTFLKNLPQMMESARNDYNLTFKISYSRTGDLFSKHVKKFWNLRHPTAGILPVSEAILLCDRVHLYGFYPFHEDLEGNVLSHHYYEEIYTWNYNRMNRQSWYYEFHSLKKLHEQGVIRMVTKKCIP